MNNQTNNGGATVPLILLLFVLWLGLTAGNFAAAYFAGREWATATKCAFAQLIAYVALWVAQRVTRQNAEGHAQGKPDPKKEV